MRILVDCDGVLFQFTEALSKYLVDRGYDYTIDKFDAYDLQKCLEPKHHWLIPAAASNKQFCVSIPRYEGAQQFLKELKKRGHEITLVTHFWTGPHWHQTRAESIDSLLSAKMLEDTPWHWASPEERVEFEADILIDDRPATCGMWARKGKPALMPVRRWNSYTNPEASPGFIHRGASYDHMLNLIDKLK